MFSRKIAAVVVYFLLWLGCFQLKEIILIPNNKNLQTLFFCLLAGFLLAYMNGFEIFRMKIKNSTKDDAPKR